MSILLSNMSKQFGESLIVDNVSVEIEDGELFVLLGASGSGKSTVLRLIAGLLTPNNGRILLHGRDVTWLPPQQRGVGFVFQNYSIFRHMNVADNVEFGLKIRGIPAAERAKRREELLHLVGLAGLNGRFANQLSGGQQQRVALARALAYEPAVLLLDEPFSALDVKIRSQLRRTLKQIQSQLKVTTIMVTHDQEEAFELADRIGVMDRGRLLEVGTPEQLYQEPRTPFAATFVGGGTVLVGRCDEKFARFGPLQFPIPATVPHEDGASVQMLVRPEQVRLTSERPLDDAPLIGQGVVIEQTFSGPVRRLRLRLPRLPATRQITPPLPFGENHLWLDATLPAGQPFPDGQVWASLTGWHILEQPRLNLLVYDPGEGPLGALTIAAQIQAAFLAQVTVTAVAASPEQAATLRTAIYQRVHQTGLAPVEVRVREGNPAEQLQHEQLSVGYDFFLLPTTDAPGELSTSVSKLIEAVDLPYFLVRGGGGQLRRLLICTAGGEPGKQDVRVGGRLARRLGAKVTLLHVQVGEGELDGLSKPVQQHLERGVNTLQGLEVEANYAVGSGGSVIAGILNEVERGQYDCVIIGRHVSSGGDLFEGENVMQQVLRHSSRPVLVIPEPFNGR